MNDRVPIPLQEFMNKKQAQWEDSHNFYLGFTLWSKNLLVTSPARSQARLDLLTHYPSLCLTDVFSTPQTSRKLFVNDIMVKTLACTDLNITFILWVLCKFKCAIISRIQYCEVHKVLHCGVVFSNNLIWIVDFDLAKLFKRKFFFVVCSHFLKKTIR